MIKVLQIVSHLKRNGTETFIMNLFHSIDSEKYHFDFLVFTDDTEGYYDEISSTGSKIFRLPPRKHGIVNYYSNLNKFFATHSKDYNVAHMHVSSFSSIAPLIYAKRYGIKKRIFHSHSTNCTGIHNKILHNLFKFAVPNIATDFLACSSSALKWAYHFTKAESVAKVITNGIDTSKFSYNMSVRSKIRNEFNLGDSFVIGHVGSFNTIKNHSFLLNTFSEVLKIHNNSKLICVGDGSLMLNMQNLAISLGIESKVIFTGKRTDVYSIMQAMDVFVMPSLYEGLPFVLIEAQAASLPIVASTGITSEINLSYNYTVLPLEAGHKIWAKKIIEFMNKEREPISNHDPIQQYSIFNTVNQMKKIYCDTNS